MNKEERKNKAKKHHEYMQRNYGTHTSYSVLHGKVYNDEKLLKIPTIVVTDKTTENAVFDFYKNHKNEDIRCCVLNFASFKHPGGGFINGAIAQEEALCHVSNLYEILNGYEALYEQNINNQNDGLYKNWAIYSPEVTFVKDEGTNLEEYYRPDVITCPAPNLRRFLTCIHNANAKYYDVLFSRCKYILDIANRENVKYLILGAFGCGVFGNSPENVSKIFKELLRNGNYNFDTVEFAVPKGKDEINYRVFKKTLG